MVDGVVFGWFFPCRFFPWRFLFRRRIKRRWRGERLHKFGLRPLLGFLFWRRVWRDGWGRRERLLIFSRLFHASIPWRRFKYCRINKRFGPRTRRCIRAMKNKIYIVSEGDHIEAVQLNRAIYPCTVNPGTVAAAKILYIIMPVVRTEIKPCMLARHRMGIQNQIARRLPASMHGFISVRTTGTSMAS